MTLNSDTLPALTIKKLMAYLVNWTLVQVLRIGQVQFFDDDLIKFVNILSNKGSRDFLSGIDVDYFGKVFDLYAQHISLVRYGIKLHENRGKCRSVDFFVIDCRSPI